ncbi:uncharacterized protein [Henckelia pumila]|uniref:uncharacterized protein isoform X3 n=1 Tax=Henckelia pumila TaxID=405737 RepID=UPI003C6E9AF0
MGIGNLLLELEFVLNQQERGALLINWVCRKGVCVTSIIRPRSGVDRLFGHERRGGSYEHEFRFHDRKIKREYTLHVWKKPSICCW